MGRYRTPKTRRSRGFAETPAGAPSPAKVERLDLRVTEDVKALIQRAAEMEGRSVSDFILGAVLPEARRVLLEVSTIRMSRAGQEQIADLLARPPTPNRKLRDLFERRKGTRANG